MKCVSTISFSGLLNGIPGEEFIPEKGLRQGDLLSPYQFILCAKVPSRLIFKAQEDQALHRVKVARLGPEISHLFFADDGIVFSKLLLRRHK